MSLESLFVPAALDSVYRRGRGNFMVTGTRNRMLKTPNA
jgi:hypothetical protein